ncbi:hypothetical protein WA026_014134 [Henosepilachna vigintioctopunctata]|uniref:Uncharacterized protein n=1 Tax=Henosepilachna vigintioctopunctata TaxID=420089 RepID=A0AAW1TV36_9CUCU
MFTRPAKQSKAATIASFKISHILAKHKKPFEDGSVVKEAFIEAEHWQSLGKLRSYNFNGYRLASAFSRGKGSHGGSALYCKESIEFKVGPDTSPLADIDFFFKRFMSILNVAIRENSKIVILGDFDVDTLGRSQSRQNNFQSGGDISGVVERFNEHFITAAPNLISKLQNLVTENLNVGKNLSLCLRSKRLKFIML